MASIPAENGYVSEVWFCSPGSVRHPPRDIAPSARCLSWLCSVRQRDSTAPEFSPGLSLLVHQNHPHKGRRWLLRMRAGLMPITMRMWRCRGKLRMLEL